jgi:hypothetical protein
MIAFLWNSRTMWNAMKTTRTGLRPSINGSGANGLSKRSRADGQALKLWFCRALAGVSAAGLVAVTGCKKAPEAPPPGTVQAGVRVEMPKLDTEFTNARPEIQAMVKQIKNSYRAGRFTRMLTELDALSNDPDLGASQKKLVGDLTEEIKQVMAKMPGPPR